MAFQLIEFQITRKKNIEETTKNKIYCINMDLNS